MCGHLCLNMRVCLHACRLYVLQSEEDDVKRVNEWEVKKLAWSLAVSSEVLISDTVRVVNGVNTGAPERLIAEMESLVITETPQSD